jgi:hypothetical protein
MRVVDPLLVLRCRITNSASDEVLARVLLAVRYSEVLRVETLRTGGEELASIALYTSLSYKDRECQ